MKRTVGVVILALLLASCSGPAQQPRTLPTSGRPSPSPTVSPTPTPHPSPSTPGPSPKPNRAGIPMQSQPYEPPPPPPPRGVADVYVLCDSVLLSAGDELRDALAPRRVTVDCLGSRRLPQGITVLEARRDEIRSVAVIHLGNNYIASEGDFGDQIDRAMRVLRGVGRVVWVTVAERWESRVGINREIRAAAGRWPTIRVADWAPVIAAHPEYSHDMLHLSPSGQRAIARLIAKAVDAA